MLEVVLKKASNPSLPTTWPCPSTLWTSFVILPQEFAVNSKVHLFPSWRSTITQCLAVHTTPVSGQLVLYVAWTATELCVFPGLTHVWQSSCLPICWQVQHTYGGKGCLQKQKKPTRCFLLCGHARICKTQEFVFYFKRYPGISLTTRP